MVYPELWTKDQIIPIYKKKGDQNNCNNYRGVTLLSCLGKVYTSIINNRLQKYCEINYIIDENEAGLRAG